MAVLLLAACGSSSPSPTASARPSATAATAQPSASTRVSPTPRPPTASPVPGPPHVMLIVMENREYSEVAGSPAAPYVNSLMARFGLATQSYAAGHPSLPNYLDLVSGSTQGVRDDGTGYLFTAPTVADQLAARGIGWRAYMEGAPSPCFLDASAPGGYAKKHNPFAYFTGVVRNPSQCDEVVPGWRLGADLAAGTAPPFIWLTPDLCHDGHDCSTATADAWLHTAVGAVLASPWYAEGGIVIVTWDEGVSSAGCCGGASGGHVVTLVVSAATRPGSRLSAPVDHAGVLRTIEDLYGLPRLGDAACPCSGSLLPLLGRL